MEVSAAHLPSIGVVSEEGKNEEDKGEVEASLMTRLPQELKDQIFDYMFDNTLAPSGIEVDIMAPRFADIKSPLQVDKQTRTHTQQAMQSMIHFKAICHNLEEAREASKRARVIFGTSVPDRRLEVVLMAQKKNQEAWLNTGPKIVRLGSGTPQRYVFDIDVPWIFRGVVVSEPFVPGVVWYPGVRNRKRISAFGF